jgi:hypothetical protein
MSGSRALDILPFPFRHTSVRLYPTHESLTDYKNRLCIRLIFADRMAKQGDVIHGHDWNEVMR